MKYIGRADAVKLVLLRFLVYRKLEKRKIPLLLTLFEPTSLFRPILFGRQLQSPQSLQRRL